jgi:hypothetical protein
MFGSKLKFYVVRNSWIMKTPSGARLTQEALATKIKFKETLAALHIRKDHLLEI